MSRVDSIAERGFRKKTPKEVEASLVKINKDVLCCCRCALRENATAPVCGIGEIGAKYLLIGEAPGKSEDEEGVPFVGASGRRLDKLMSLAGISLNDCYLTNVCRCRPLGNRNPKKAEIRECSGFLWREIRLIKPQYIIALGATPLSLFHTSGVRTMHGTLFTYELEDE